MEHYPVEVEGPDTGELWRCAVCGDEHTFPPDTADKEQAFNNIDDCVGYNPTPG